MSKEEIVRTKGNVIVNEIKVGDIHYEYDMGMAIKSKVKTLPVKGEDGNWTWLSENYTSGKDINYMVNPEYPHYSVNLYDYEAYSYNDFL